MPRTGSRRASSGSPYARSSEPPGRTRVPGRREMTGSRTGMVGSLKIYVPGPGGYQQIDGSKFYDARYWEPEKYQQWHDAIWQQPRIGRVTVGEVEQTDGPAVDSRVPATAPDVDAAAPEAPEVPADAIPGTTPPPEE